MIKKFGSQTQLEGPISLTLPDGKDSWSYSDCPHFKWHIDGISFETKVGATFKNIGCHLKNQPA